jgi:hypothetical protein
MTTAIKSIQNLKFRYLKDDHKVHILTAPDTLITSIHGGGKHYNQPFNLNKYYTRPYVCNRRKDTFNVLVGHTKKHPCDLMKLVTAPQELDSLVATVDLAHAKHIATCLHMPLVVLLSKDEDENDDEDSAYYFDPNVQSPHMHNNSHAIIPRKYMRFPPGKKPPPSTTTNNSLPND